MTNHPRDTDPNELTQQTLAALEKLAQEDRNHLVTKLTLRSTPPKSHSVTWQVVQSIVVAIIVAGLGAALVLWRNDAVTQDRQATTDRRIDGVIRDVEDHDRSGVHPQTLATLAEISAELRALNDRLARIERQLDGQRSRPR